MQPGQTLAAKDGTQVVLWPFPVMNITQLSGPGSLSHCCGNPVDCVGPTDHYDGYAPCDCHEVYRDNVGNTRGYTSDNEVYYASPSGTGWVKGYVSFSFTHNNNPPAQTSFKQGERITSTGTAGMVTGDHCHLDQSPIANAQLVSYGVTCDFGNLCYALQDSVSPETIFFINDTQILNSQGLTFSTFVDGTKPPTPEPTYHTFLLPIDPFGIELLPIKIQDEKPSPPEPTPIAWIIPGDINNTRPLTEDEAYNNCRAFWSYFKAKGWSLNAVSGILGNAWHESTVNPNRWQGDDAWHQPPDSWGYGLVQWTPYTKIITWLQEQGVYPDVSKFGQSECDRIQWEMENNQQWIATTTYPESFRAFSTSTRDSYDLAIEFLANYERPLDPNQPERGDTARIIYNYLLQYE